MARDTNVIRKGPRTVDEFCRFYGIDRTSLYRQIESHPDTPIIKRWMKEWQSAVRQAEESTRSAFARALKIMGASDDDVVKALERIKLQNKALRAAIATKAKRQKAAVRRVAVMTLKSQGKTEKEIAQALNFKSTRGVRKSANRK